MNAAFAWRLPLDEKPPFRNWNGTYVVYNPLSGSTHVLDIVAGEVLRCVAQGQTTEQELSHHIARFLDVPDDLRTAANVREVLHSLDELGLIERVRGC